MMHNSLHQFPALSLRLYQPGLQFIAEGHELSLWIPCDPSDRQILPLNLIFELQVRVSHPDSTQNVLMLFQTQPFSCRSISVKHDLSSSPKAGSDSFYLCIQYHIVQSVLCTGLGQSYPSIAHNKNNSCRMGQDVPSFDGRFDFDLILWIQCRRELPDEII